MIYAIGAIVLSLLGVYAMNKSHRLYVEEKGTVVTIISIVYAFAAVASATATYHSVVAFIKYLKG